jgi:predicted membrane-bound mannosyltransferase
LSIFALVAATLAMAFFSSFGKNPTGILDSLTTYFNYSDKAFDNPHVKPFGWYLSTFFVPFKIGKLTFIFEAAVPVLALIAAVCACWKSPWRGTERRVAVFSLLSGAALLLLYSWIRYKTPWLVLGVLPPLWLAAGLGFVAGVRLLDRLRQKRQFPGLLPAVFFRGALLLAIAAQWRCAVSLNGRFAADERNPLAYVHTSTDVQGIAKQAAKIARFADPNALFARVHTAEYAPLLWYLRAYEGRVWFSHAVPEGDLDAPIVITDASTEALVAPRLRAKYIEEPMGLRPGVLLNFRLREDLFRRAIAEE